MNRRKFLITVGMGTLAAPFASLAQQGKVWRIGVLRPGSRPAAGDPSSSSYANFIAGMRDLGYVEGRNIVVLQHYADNQPERLREHAARLVKEKVDVIVTNGTPGVHAAREATTTIPIVALAFADPVASGFAASFVRPGGNVTGISNFGSETGDKRMEFMASIVPHVTRIAVLYNPDNPANARAISRRQLLGRKIGKELVHFQARDVAELGAAFESMARERVGALLVAEEPFLNGQRERIGALALRYKLPTTFANLGAAEHGLLVYGPNFGFMGRRAAALVDKILKGAKPGDLPIEQPTHFHLVINLKIAKALGVTIPPSIMVQATRVIE